MKRLYLLLISLLICTLLLAQNRTDEQMKAIAVQKLHGAMARGFGISTNIDIKEMLSNDEYSIYGAEKGGFVVVSRNNDIKPVIGYSSSTFDADNIPCGMKWWLNEMENSLRTRRNLWNEINSAGFTPTPSFITTKWGQDQPYNNLTPIGTNNAHMPTGCMATAMSQVMKYFRYPAQGQGTGYYKNASGINKFVAISTVYEWDKMKDQYTKLEIKTMTDEQKKPIASLMFEAGASSQMDYSSEGSGTFDDDAANGFVNNFQYDSLALHNYSRVLHSNEEWMTMVYNELSNKRPILYCGYDEESGGHAFVLDGIDSEGLVSVNWGWEGSSDGFYNIDYLAPNGSGYSFVNNHSMIIGFKTQAQPDADEKYMSYFGCNGTYALRVLAANKLEVSTIPSIYNFHYLTFYGTIGLFFMNNDNAKDNYEIAFFNTGDNSDVSSPLPARYGFSSENFGKLIGNSIDLSELKPGSYTVFIGSKAVQETMPSHARCPGGMIEYTLTKAANGALTLSEAKPVTGIKNIEVPTPQKYSNAWYTIDGQRLNGEPTQRGIYIHNGQKFVVK